MARKRQTFLILLGISFGTLLYVGISGIQLGVRQYLSEQLLNNTAHIIIKGQEKNISAAEVSREIYPGRLVSWVTEPSGKRENSRLGNVATWYSVLKNDPRVREFSPRLTTNAVLMSGKFNNAVMLIGTVPEKQVRISSIEKYMREGSFLELKGANNLVIGSGIARELGVKRGQYVRASTGGRSRIFRVVGVYHFGNEQVDRTLAFCNLTDAQIVAGTPGRVNGIAVALFDIDRAISVADQWQLLSKDKVEDWQEANQSFMEMIKVQDFVRYFITLAILLVASFGVYNVLSIMINQKRKEIAILRAIGFGPPKILQLVLYQGMVMGLAGGFLGTVLGYFFCRFVESIELSINLGGSNHLWVSYDFDIFVSGFLAALFSAIIASVIPARSASRMTPMDIIRAE